MLMDALTFLPLCAISAIVYQATRSDDLSTLLRRALRSFILWTLGMIGISVVVTVLALVL